MEASKSKDRWAIVQRCDRRCFQEPHPPLKDSAQELANSDTKIC